MADNVVEPENEMVALPTEPVVSNLVDEELEELDPEMKNAYNIVMEQVEDILTDGMVSEDNVAWIIKAVMEAIDAVAVFAEWPGAVKAAKGKLLAKHIINDLHKRGKVNDDVYKKLMTALSILSLAMFTLSVLGDKGKILFQHVKNGLQRACARCKNRQQEQFIQDKRVRRNRAALKAKAKNMHVASQAKSASSASCNCGCHKH